MSKDNWGTPEWLLAKVRKFYNGYIGLDPCSSELHQKRVYANHYYTEKDNGLKHPWYGNIFCNPPYSHPGLWVDKATKEFKTGDKEIIMLLPAVFRAKWGQQLWKEFPLVLLFDKRLAFYSPFLNEEVKGNRDGSLLVYLGSYGDNFIQDFHMHGTIIERVI